MGCHLVILACNTASAKALRSIQMNDLPGIDPARRVLGVIRPTVECVGEISKNQHIGVLATAGTIKSESYPLEIHKLFPEIQVSGTACPMWVSLVENNESQERRSRLFYPEVHQPITVEGSSNRYCHPRMYSFPHTPTQNPAIYSGAYQCNCARRVCCRKSERLSEKTSRNGCKMHEEWELSVLHDRSGRKVFRIGLYFPETAD